MSASRDRPFESPPPPPSATTQQPSSSPIPISVVGHHQQDFKNERSMKDRLLSDLWLMSAATFRRLGKIDQAKGAIQEAEVKDENNPAVWVQVWVSQFFVFFQFMLIKKKIVWVVLYRYWAISTCGGYFPKGFVYMSR
jgi:hypothetical protein